jgi:peptidoglycan/xylan/chitin deacetylase (PgdA/CDA1 family)
MKLLGYKTINIDELLIYLNGERISAKRPILITFDDGYENNYINAYPILKKMNLVATICVCTAYIGKKESVFEKEKYIKGKMPENYLAEEEIVEMSQNHISFCSHGINHFYMDELEGMDLENEITKSKETLEKILNMKINFFCYPYGRYNQKTIEALKNAGYEGAFTTKRGKVSKEDNPYELKRLVIKGYNRTLNFLSTIEFLYKLLFF